ncbi:MAG: hypothetical protein NVSMB13_21370 [Mycobacteriales bacterium]
MPLVVDVAKAHEADLATQGSHGVSYRKYWVDEAGGKIFRLVGCARRAGGQHSPSGVTWAGWGRDLRGPGALLRHPDEPLHG